LTSRAPTIRIPDVLESTVSKPALIAAAWAAALGLLGAAAQAYESADEIRDLMSQEQQQNNVYKVTFPSPQLARRAAISFHESVLEVHYADGYLIMQLDADTRARLESFGFVLQTADDWLAQRNARLERFKARAGIALLGQAAQGADPESIDGFPCYETVEETFDEAKALVSKYPKLAEWIDVGDSWQKARGNGGYDIRVLKLTNSAEGGKKPKLFINTAIHAREYATAPLALAFARRLTKGYGSDADVTWIMDHHEVHLMLHTNPDGRKKAETGLLWRKNTNTSYCGPSSPLRGADLNRNFTLTWNFTQGVGSSGNECSEVYRGPSAGSEPETQAMEDYVRSLWPDRRGDDLDDKAPNNTSGVHIDIHSVAQLVLWPYGERSKPAPNGPAMEEMGRRLAYFNGYTPDVSIGLYPTDGTTDSVSYAELGVPSFTIELGETSFFESCARYESKVRPDNLPALLYAAKVVRTPYITPGGPDVTQVKLSDNAADEPVPAGTKVKLTANTTDLRFNNSNGKADTHAITQAEYTIDTPPWQSAAKAVALNAADGRFDSKTEDATGTIDTTGLRSGKHLVFVRARDASNTWGPVTASFLRIR
jgi:carboxypeptidase T